MQGLNWLLIPMVFPDDLPFHKKFSTPRIQSLISNIHETPNITCPFVNDRELPRQLHLVDW